MMSSFKINEVNEMATMLMNSDSKRKSERSMMTLPVKVIWACRMLLGRVLARNIYCQTCLDIC